jgi:hypothetical protein
VVPQVEYKIDSTLGFMTSKGDTSLFIYKKGGITIFWLNYVNDIVVVSSSNQAIKQCYTIYKKNLCQ